MQPALDTLLVQVEQIAQAQRLFAVLIAVSVGNAPPGGAKGRALFGQAVLLQAILYAMPRHRDGSLVGKFQVFRADGNAAFLNGSDLFGQMVQINNHTCAQHAHHIGVQNARRQQVQHELTLIGHHGVPGVVAALITCDNVCVFCQQVDDAAFAFIAPVDPCYCGQHMILFLSFCLFLLVFLFH